MAISLSIEQLKSVGLQDRADGFLFFRVVKELGKGLYQIQLNGKLITVKSDQPLVLHTPLKASLIQKRIGNQSFVELSLVKKKLSLPNAPKDSDLLKQKGSFFFPPPLESEKPALLLSKILFQRGLSDWDVIPQAFKLLQKHYTSKKSLYLQKEQSSFLKTTASLAFAQKGMLLPESVADSFLNLLFAFSPQKKEPQEESLLLLFNHSHNIVGLQWILLPFTLGEGENQWGGSFSIGLERRVVFPNRQSDSSFQEGSFSKEKVRYVNINSSLNQMPFSIHFDLSKKCYYLCGDYFSVFPKVSKKIQTLLRKTDFHLASLTVLPSDSFDGFELIVDGGAS